MKLVIYDFDDTLCKTYSRTKVTHSDGQITYLLPHEFAVFSPKTGDQLDFSEFHELVNPMNFHSMIEEFRSDIRCGHTVVILTARPSALGVDQWLESLGLGTLPVKALKSSTSQSKADWIERRIKEGFDDITFYDDAKHYIDAVTVLAAKYPEIKWKIEHVQHS